MKKPVIIAAAVLLALLTAAGILLLTNKKDSTPGAGTQPNVRIMEETAATSDPMEEAYLRQIAELQAQVEKLEQEKGQAEFDRTALQTEQEKLQKRLEDLEKQNQYLRGRNNTLSDEGNHLQDDIATRDEKIAQNEAEISALKEQLDQIDQASKEQKTVIASLNKKIDQVAKERDDAIAYRSEGLTARDDEIAQLNEKIDQLEKERNALDIAYQKALAQAYEYRESWERRDQALTQAESPGQIHVNRRGKLVNTFNILPPGQSRNSLGIKFGNRNINLDGSIALMPHWYLLGSLGIDQVHDDFVKDEFPGYDADNAFFYDVLFGTGLNWRFNRIQSQPNFYINTAIGPAWFLYKQDGEVELKTYFIWRSSVGFDLTLHKHLQFTGDIGVDWVQNYGFSPRFSLGALWSFSHDWSIIGKK